MGLTCKVLEITPDMAKEMLKHNRVNRDLNISRAKQYAQEMIKGRWELNGETISFYENGDLSNGQHRLTGVVIANTPITALVVYGVKENVTVQDRGRARNLTDSMLIGGFDKALANNTVVAIAKLHFMFQYNNRNIPDSEVKDFILRNSDLLRLLMENVPKPSRNVVKVKNACILLPCFYALNCKECTIETISSFLQVVSSGIPENLSQSAAIILRNDILNSKYRMSSTKERLNAIAKVEKAISDFNNGYNRRQSYVNYDTPIYSSNKKNKEA